MSNILKYVAATASASTIALGLSLLVFQSVADTRKNIQAIKTAYAQPKAPAMYRYTLNKRLDSYKLPSKRLVVVDPETQHLSVVYCSEDGSRVPELKEAIEWWRSYGYALKYSDRKEACGEQLLGFVEVYLSDDDELFEKASEERSMPNIVGLYTPYSLEGRVLFATIELRASQMKKQDVFAEAVVHELGHALGFGHDTKGLSVMNKVITDENVWSSPPLP